MLCNDLKLPTDGNANDVNSQALCAKDGLEQKENKKNYYLIQISLAFLKTNELLHLDNLFKSYSTFWVMEAFQVHLRSCQNSMTESTQPAVTCSS